MEFDGTELSEAIAAVREGLTAAQQDGTDSEIRFKVKDVVLDLGLELRRTAGAGGGVKAIVFSGDVRGELATARIHRLTVTLEVDGSDRVLINGQGEVGRAPSGRFS
ncbi:hypothetical protein OG401_41910 [Kitasatospora purpeofusca]|uniref:trypco2 family protein n=1 Tax=Kitasatospora purpeofusca TaxID=67352 RepID=UPI0022585003|nr:trypco2 family protein [Kitasatospora purpeofusca]MCX4690777.1 hypothetical protein [Kitasatospora purpeofusca]WSR46038.1 hypothetical protein OG196_43855 [Kitasatospora purpeofusca]